jgi:N-acetylmuramoyl-L-alanine amidase
MRLYRVGDEGPAVRDIQDRLAALGFEPGADARAVFAEGTRQAVLEFQKAKGLDADGIVGPNTWRSLYEAGYRLGDRLLFLRRPMMRGEDVAELQSRLGSLGFDTGKVDGIFGPDTEAAVIDFQHNRHLAEDGKVGPEAVTEIHLVTRGDMKEGRQAIREQEWRAAGAPPTAAALAIQEAGGVPMMSRSNDTQLPERLRARRANRVGSDLIVAFRLNRDGDDCVFYFASEHSSSRAGEALANALALTVGGRVEGRASAMLKETRAPAAVVALRAMDEKTGLAVAEGLNQFFAETR